MTVGHLSGWVALVWAVSGCSGPAPTSITGEQSPDLVSARTGLVQRVDVEIRAGAVLLDDKSISLSLRARCPGDFQVIEGPVSVMQGPEFQEVFGEGFFTIACNNRWQRQRVRVISPEGFYEGRAKATASLMVEHPTGEFLQGDDSRTLKIR